RRAMLAQGADRAGGIARRADRRAEVHHRLREIARAATLVPPGGAGDFAQAMMDLGATICTTRNPACAICPLREHCAAARTGDPAAFPVKLEKKAKPHRHATAFWIAHEGDVLLVRRPARGMLGNMRALPTGPWQDDPPGLAGAPIEADWRGAGSVRHIFTHFSLDLRVEAAVVSARPGLNGEWWPIKAIEQAGLPTLFAKAAMLGPAAIEEMVSPT
ncbi:MAG: NUDIX domain-containing protein, partial [Sphingomonadaceae bacterium]|nr:NUDIX domain-containing protein [Sphingomonadaceae bacterium]